MATDAFPELLPLGAAATLLVYLLRLIQYERVRWIKERASLIAEHRAELDRRELELARAETRYDALRRYVDERERARQDDERQGGDNGGS